MSRTQDRPLVTAPQHVLRGLLGASGIRMNAVSYENSQDLLTAGGPRAGPEGAGEGRRKGFGEWSLSGG
ncbi:MAG: hypothetical protein HYY93_05735 [Planctomycetes bacterium]|nr:hypothetical protein [Planctomycetota bacterium]